MPQALFLRQQRSAIVFVHEITSKGLANAVNVSLALISLYILTERVTFYIFCVLLFIRNTMLGIEKLLLD